MSSQEDSSAPSSAAESDIFKKQRVLLFRFNPHSLLISGTVAHVHAHVHVTCADMEHGTSTAQTVVSGRASLSNGGAARPGGPAR